MTKGFFAVAVVALLAPMALQAQASATVDATATIARSATFSGGQDLQFGTVGSAGMTISASDANAGFRTLAYNYGLTVSFSGVPTELTSGSNTLPVSLTCDVKSGASWMVETACSGATFDLAAPTAAATADVAVGGAIDGADADAAAAGDYTGTITINVTP